MVKMMLVMTLAMKTIMMTTMILMAAVNGDDDVGNDSSGEKHED